MNADIHFIGWLDRCVVAVRDDCWGYASRLCQEKNTIIGNITININMIIFIIAKCLI